MRIAIDKQTEYARELLKELYAKQEPALDSELVNGILEADQSDETGIFEQRQRIAKLKKLLNNRTDAKSLNLSQLADNLCRKSVWLIGGDGWAYDIGYGGLDHVLASGKDVNILVLDTEVYSKTGGQTSKATPRGAIAKFSAGGKATAKKDLALLAMSYENVYVANIALGAKDVQTLRTFVEAEAHHGPSLIIAYAPCISQGVDMKNSLTQQKLAVDSGHCLLFRFDPKRLQQGENPMHLDSKEPSVPYKDYMQTETRFSMLWQSHPESAEKLLQQAQHEVTQRYHFFKQLSEMDWDEGTGVAAIKKKINEH